MSYYPDTHPDIKDNLVAIQSGGVEKQYLPREEYEKVARQRDDLNRTLALIGVWRLLPIGQRDELALDRLLAGAGQTKEISEAVAGIVSDVIGNNSLLKGSNQ